MTFNNRVIQLVALALLGGCLPPPPSSTQNGAVYFDPDIQTTMDVIGCSTVGCHGASGMPMHVVPPAEGGSVDANYQQVQPRTVGGASSLLLTKPVQGASVPHGGGKLIPMNGATYNQWLAWINAGAPLRAPGTNTPPPAGTTPPTTTPDGGTPPPTTTPPTTTPPTGACVAVQPTLHTSHNAGQECLSCHAGGQNPLLRWTLAGTVFADSFGTTPRGGATVDIVDARGQELKLVTDVQGNFYTTSAVTFPITVNASACPSTKSMVGKPPMGGCNGAGCHDATRPIFLP
jgi:hypothetical protein